MFLNNYRQLRKCHATIVNYTAGNGTVDLLWSYWTPQIAIVRGTVASDGVYEFTDVRGSQSTSRQKTRFYREFGVNRELVKKCTLSDFELLVSGPLSKPDHLY